MATGITKKYWSDDTHIVSGEEYAGEYSFEITYPGKILENKIIKSTPRFQYKSIYNTNKIDKVYYGDNLDVLKHLLHQCALKGKVKLIYIDPPYGTNSVFQSRNQKSSYRDDLVGSHYLEFMRRRLILMRELLSNDGSIYVHLDGNMTFQIKVIMDEIFGAKNYRGSITRKKCSNKNYTTKTFGNISDYILFYSKSDNYIWHRATEPWSEEKIKKEYSCIDESTGRRYKKVPIHAPGLRNGETGKAWKGMMPPPGKHWQYIPKKLTELDNNGEIYWSSNGNPRRKVFFDKDKGIPVQDIWLDVQDSLNQNIKITGYPTEKNPYLLERIIKASSNEGDLILDCFAGSGTTLDVASQLNRRFIGIDNSSEAIFNIIKRFVTGLSEMGDYVSKKPNSSNSNFQMTLFENGVKYNPKLLSRFNFEVLSDIRFKKKIKEILELFDLPTDINRVRESNINSQDQKNKNLLNDSVLKKLIEKIGDIELYPKSSEFGFRYLCEAIVSQQLSISASKSIILKISNYFSNDFTPKIILETDENVLHGLGVSNRKISYLKDLASKVYKSDIVIENLENLSNDEIINELTRVKGIGKWTSKMYLIFVLARPDVFPVEDAAFISHLKVLYGLSKNNDFEKSINRIEQKWKPYQSIGALYIWKSKDSNIIPNM